MNVATMYPLPSNSMYVN